MNHITGHLAELAAAGLIVIFCIGVLLYKIPGTEEGGVLKAAASLIQSKEEHDISSDNQIRLQNILDYPEPEITYRGGVLRVGSTVALRDCFDVTTGGLDRGEGFCLRAVYNKAGDDILKSAELSSKDEAEELFVEMSYFADSQEICFHKSGVYRLQIQATGAMGRRTLQEVEIPVEAKWGGA